MRRYLGRLALRALVTSHIDIAPFCERLTTPEQLEMNSNRHLTSPGNSGTDANSLLSFLQALAWNPYHCWQNLSVQFCISRVGRQILYH